MSPVNIAARICSLNEINPLRLYGKIQRIVGLTVESEGPPVAVGEILRLEEQQFSIPLQVIGFSGTRVLSMPLGELTGLTQGMRLYATGQFPGFKVSEEILGRVIDSLGRPLDDQGDYSGQERIVIYQTPPNAMRRDPISEVLATGVKAIDGLITIGKGQRMGIFSGSGIGKSTLLGMIARNTNADVNIVALVGERGRELKDFIINSLGEEGLRRSVVVAATSDQPPLLKILCAFTATALAEYFCRQDRDVLLMMDSLTRLAMAQREVGLSAGEPPSSKGYTPSVFSMMPRLLERAGNFSGMGSITGIYSVLVEGDDVTEPVSDHARSILDGHVLLARDLAHRNQYPAVDVLGSISRLMVDVTTVEHRSWAGKIRELLAAYRDAEDLINIGAYVRGSNPRIDEALAKISAILEFLRQGIYDKVTFPRTVELLHGTLA